MAETVWWRDEPLVRPIDDEFGRRPYAQRTAQLIDATHSWDASIVFGLTGPWGSGKSTLINFVEFYLGLEDPRWAVARFTPWAAGDASALLGEFYTALSRSLPANRSDSVRSAL